METKTEKMVENLNLAVSILEEMKTGHYLDGVFYMHMSPNSKIPDGKTITLPTLDEFKALVEEKADTRERVSKLKEKFKDLL